MFYNKQPKEKQNLYKAILNGFGEKSILFSTSDCPFLHYRAHENSFCYAFDAENLARGDISADAKKEDIGIGLKTWVGNDDQKVAEFGKLSPQYKRLRGLSLVKKISEYRNERIRVTKNMYGINEMIYHVVKRIPNKMQIYECPFDKIDINNIKLINKKCSNTNTYFTDGKHTYHFSSSKNTLYMIFDDMELLDDFNVKIITDPVVLFQDMSKIDKKGDIFDRIKKKSQGGNIIDNSNTLCLRLYSTKKVKKNKVKFVPEKSGLNQWHAGGRKRDKNEIYIPYPMEDHKRNIKFFPDRDKVFNLHMPDGSIISAKVCQENGKAIMSNPNKALGEWLLRNVFELKEGTLVTYEMLEKFNIDSVVFTKNSNTDYSINFAELGTYEKIYNLE